MPRLYSYSLLPHTQEHRVSAWSSIPVLLPQQGHLAECGELFGLSPLGEGWCYWHLMLRGWD